MVAVGAVVERNVHVRRCLKFECATLYGRRAAGDAFRKVRDAAIKHVDRAASVIDGAVDVEDAAIARRQRPGIGYLVSAGVDRQRLARQIGIDRAAVLVVEPQTAAAGADITGASIVLSTL